MCKVTVLVNKFNILVISPAPNSKTYFFLLSALKYINNQRTTIITYTNRLSIFHCVRSTKCKILATDFHRFPIRPRNSFYLTTDSVGTRQCMYRYDGTVNCPVFIFLDPSTTYRIMLSTNDNMKIMLSLICCVQHKQFTFYVFTISLDKETYLLMYHARTHRDHKIRMCAWKIGYVNYENRKNNMFERKLVYLRHIVGTVSFHHVQVCDSEEI